MKRPCVSCGELTDGSRCEDCRAASERDRPSLAGRRSKRERGYTSTWDTLSKRARRIQPWCSDCGATRHLSLDHLPSGWWRVEHHLPLRLGVDVEVVCADCNAARGSSRPGSERYAAWLATAPQGEHPGA